MLTAYLESTETSPLSFICRPNGNLAGEVIDPYVKVQLRGHPDDKYKYKTDVVKNNGFNPVWWNAKTTFLVTVPELAMLELIVKDHATTKSNLHIGSFACPVKALRNGMTSNHIR